MAAVSRVIYLCIILFIIQTCSAKALEDTSSYSLRFSRETNNKTPTLAILAFAVSRYLSMTNKYINKSVDLTKQLLKDETWADNDNAEILEFKENLTKFIENYETIKDSENIWNIFNDTNGQYKDIWEKKHRNETEFLKDLLSKYNDKNLEQEFVDDLDQFVNELKKLFRK